ncbi:hypothetical protein Ddye_000547 [Dipteronia dyeriana]|uniref:Uncharacterized protein n=1 Tax=Dipteronia dyeriana TaxID=168575 RepID=A0AAD9XN86_9ROSI|nr:hypothetical protein Ddye_000547 [Dipteronia dyeriana]
MNCLERSNNDAIKRLERQLAENKGKEIVGRQTQGDGRRSHSSWCEAEFSTGEVDEPNLTGNRDGFKRGGRVECEPLVVKHWLHDVVSEGEMDDGYVEDVRWDMRHRGRMPIYRQRREQWRCDAVYECDRSMKLQGPIEFLLHVSTLMGRLTAGGYGSNLNMSKMEGNGLDGLQAGVFGLMGTITSCQSLWAVSQAQAERKSSDTY